MLELIALICGIVLSFIVIDGIVSYMDDRSSDDSED
jgi:hypothetical protein